MSENTEGKHDSTIWRSVYEASSNGDAFDWQIAVSPDGAIRFSTAVRVVVKPSIKAVIDALWASEPGDSMASAEYSNKAGRGAAKTTSNSLAPIESPASFVTIRAQQMLESAADEFRQRASIESPASPVPRPYWEEEEAANTFLRAYAQRSKMTPQRLLSLGSYPMRCECGDTMCEGWKMVSIRIDPDPPTGDPQ